LFSNVARNSQVSVFHADKFGRDAFLGVVHLPLEDVSGQNMQDWFPFKQRKPTDKVSGELHMRVVNSAHGAPLSPERTVELYSAKVRTLAQSSEVPDLTRFTGERELFVESSD
jgi:hypothetical protein